jgi:hypothetical protein
LGGQHVGITLTIKISSLVPENKMAAKHIGKKLQFALFTTKERNFKAYTQVFLGGQHIGIATNIKFSSLVPQNNITATETVKSYQTNKILNK